MTNIDLFERLTLKDKRDENSKKPVVGLHGEVEIRNQFGRVLQKKSNIILLGGRRFTLEKLFNVEAPRNKRVEIDNDIYNLDHPSEIDPNVPGPVQARCVCLWGVGIGGSGDTFGSVKVPTEKEYNVYEQIPFRYVSSSGSADAEVKETKKYYLRVPSGDGEHISYYAKRFEGTVSLVIKDGEQEYIPNIPGDNQPLDYEELINRTDVECYVSMELKLSAEDVREWFIEQNNSIDQARINEICLYIAFPTETSDEWSDFTSIEAFSKLCFNNESLDDESKELNITYKIYV